MKPTDPFIPIYDLSDSPPDGEPEPVEQEAYTMILHPDYFIDLKKSLGDFDTDYDGIIITYRQQCQREMNRWWADLLSEIAAAPIHKLGDEA